MEKKETIVELFENCIDTLFENTEEMTTISRKIVEIEDKLYPTLTVEQKELIEEINRLDADRGYELDKNIFVGAFSMATQLFVEGISK